MINRRPDLDDESRHLRRFQEQPDHRNDVQKQYPLIQQHDPQSPDMAFGGKVSHELVNVAGGLVIVYLRTDSNSFDEVFDEDPDPTYKSGVEFKAYFRPDTISQAHTEYGPDTENQTKVIFGRDHVFMEFGKRMIRPGDLIKVPYNSVAVRPDFFRVTNAYDDGNWRYDWLYYTCDVENITNDITVEIDHK